jgi:hypothetical protein
VDSPRIPIHTGFYIQIKNGKAVNPGGNDQEAIGFVESWMKRNPSDPNFHTAEIWLDLKRQEVHELEEIQSMRAKRVELDARVDTIARKSRLKDKEQIELLRKAAHDKHGIKAEE